MDKNEKKQVSKEKIVGKKAPKILVEELSPSSISKTLPESSVVVNMSSDSQKKSSKTNLTKLTTPKTKQTLKSTSKTDPLYDIAKFYKRERGKINIWTYLFRMLNKSVCEIYNMCEIENKEDFVNGVLETLESSVESFKKLKHKLSLEKLNKEQIKNISWEVPLLNSSELPNPSELEHFIEDLEEPENVDFTLLTQLIDERKMNFDEAIVLLIRERASQMDDNIGNSCSQNNSFSKCSIEILDALRDFKDDSLVESNIVAESQGQRSRSVTPSRISLCRLISRLSWRLNKQWAIKEEDENLEEKEDYIREKQARALEVRKSNEKNRQGFLNREKEKFRAAKERLENKKKEKYQVQQEISKKKDQADQRYEAHIGRIKHRAKNQIAKTHEIAFISMLETQTKKIMFDEKLDECRERKLKIMRNVKEKQSIRNLKEEAVEKRRQALAQEVAEQHRLQQAKLESAETRRLKILEGKRKHFEEINKEKFSISEKKKNKEVKNITVPTAFSDKLKQKLIKDKEKFDRILLAPLKKLSSPNSSFFTIETSSGDESRLKIKHISRLKMNSHSNSPEFNLCSDDDYSIENSILFCESKKSLLDSVSTPKIEQAKEILASEKNIPAIFKSKKPKKKNKIKKKQFEKIKTKDEKKELVISTSLPNLLPCRDSKTDHIFIRLGCKSFLSKAKVGILYPRTNKNIQLKTEFNSSEKEKEKEKKNTKNNKNANQLITTLKNKGIVKKSIISDSENKNLKEEKKENENNEIIKNENAENIIEKENIEGTIRWCSICNLILSDNITNSDHLSTKSHKKHKNLYGLTQNDDQICILTFQSGDPDNEELKTERLNAFKKRCKKIKQSLNVRALKHESACLLGKETTSPNKQRLQKLCIDLEKHILPQIKDYTQLENVLKDITKVLEGRREADLHIMRQLKFVPLLMEICKRLVVCHRNEINDILRILDFSSNLLAIFSNLADNRTYMLVTNRLMPLIDLLLWCLNRPTKFVYSLGFVPVLFGLLTSHLKHRLNNDYSNFRDDVIEYIFSNGFLLKIKQKFMSFNGGLDLSTGMGKVPLALLKSINFLETLTGYIGYDFGNKPIFEPFKISENIIFILKESDLIGIINLMVSVLLSEGSYGKIPGKLMPQTVLSLTMVSLKFLNNIARLNLDLLQKCTNSKMNEDMIYHIFNYLLTYCKENYDNSDDIKDLLNELILLIGYNSLLNEKSQGILSRGEQTIIQKLSGLPISYICDKKLKDVLFPSLICCIFKNSRNLQILFQEMSKELLINYINSQIQLFPFETNYKNEIPQNKKIEESLISEKSIFEEKKELEEGIYYNFLKYVNDSKLYEKKEARSLSISSTNSSQNSSIQSSSHHFLFPLRFPRQLWEDVVEFIKNQN